MSRSRGGSSLTTWSPINTLPPLMSSRPAIIRRAVDFPQPEGPTKTTNSPSGISRFILSTAITSSPKTLVTSSRVTSAIHLLLPSTRTHRSPRCLPSTFTPVPENLFYLMPDRPAQMVFFLDLEYAPDGLPDAGLRYLPRPGSLQDGVVGVGLLLRGTGNDEQVRPRLDRTHRGIGDHSPARSPRHREIVRDDHAVEAEVVTQHAYCILREARGALGVDGRVYQMPDHDHGYPGVDGGLERR